MIAAVTKCGAIQTLLSVLALAWWVGDTGFGQWSEWRGPRADGVWESAPELSRPLTPQLRWRKPIGAGYAGVAVADGRVYTMDRLTEPAEVERVLCFDAETGEELWIHRYTAIYGSLDYGNGPRAMPTVHEGKVYTLGAVGHLLCLDAYSGEVIWAKDTEKELNAQRPEWGFAASPVIWESTVIAHIGAKPGGSFVAFDRLTGDEVWRGANDPAGYCTPIRIEHNGGAQLIGWTPENVLGISPDTGAVYWSIPYVVTNGVSIATPIFQEGIVLVSGYWEGTKAIRLGDSPSDANFAWEENQFLRALMSQPLYRDGYAYLLDKFHGLICFKLQTGEKVWSDNHQVTPKERNPQASMVWLGDSEHALILNAEGELIHARLTPEGYDEQSRSKIIGRTWAHPAFAGGRVYARDDGELVCVQITQAQHSD